MFYIVCTPIGNLSDISLRALEVLKQVRYILCEDTRHSSILLNHYQISTPSRSFHRFNENKAEDGILRDLEQGNDIALISDAGTPGLYDPGHHLIAACRTAGLPLTVIPGANAVITALIASGFNAERFQSIGFLPKASNALHDALKDYADYPGTTIAYETPHRIRETLEAIAAIDPDWELCVAREMTKTHEEFHFGTAPSLLAIFTEKPAKGEMVLLFKERASKTVFSEERALACMEFLQTKIGLSKKDAMRYTRDILDTDRRTVYKIIENSRDP